MSHSILKGLSKVMAVGVKSLCPQRMCAVSLRGHELDSVDLTILFHKLEV